jgi:DNA-binding PadR family transcriptional regulator
LIEVDISGLIIYFVIAMNNSGYSLTAKGEEVLKEVKAKTRELSDEIMN